MDPNNRSTNTTSPSTSNNHSYRYEYQPPQRCRPQKTLRLFLGTPSLVESESSSLESKETAIDYDKLPPPSGNDPSESGYDEAEIVQRAYVYDMDKPPRIPQQQTIEVSPGVVLPLLGADVTWRAIQVDFILPCFCYVCDATRFCIEDARFCLCPVCKCVLPMDGDFGVGLGFTLEQLAEYQNELEENRKHNAARGR